MRLRNKKTGFVTNWCIDKDVIRTCDGSIVYDTIAELNSEWEDVPEEPKGYWFIDSLGEVHEHTKDSQMLDIEQTAIEDWHLDIGNHFGTKEEAEKVVEKLKAWKRLKDKGFKFTSWVYDYDQPKVENRTYFEFVAICEDEVLSNNLDDIELLFSGEDD